MNANRLFDDCSSKNGRVYQPVDFLNPCERGRRRADLSGKNRDLDTVMPTVRKFKLWVCSVVMPFNIDLEVRVDFSAID